MGEMMITGALIGLLFLGIGIAIGYKYKKTSTAQPEKAIAQETSSTLSGNVYLTKDGLYSRKKRKITEDDDI